MLRGWTLWLLLAGLTVSGPAATLNKDYLGADTRWVLHLDLEAFKKSKLGTLILTDVQSQHSEKIKALEELLGFNLLTDINHITLFGPDSQEQNGVLLIEGRFNPQKITALLALNKDYQKSAYGQYILHEWFDELRSRTQVGTFARENLIILSQSRQALEQTLDVLDGKRPSLSASGWPVFPNNVSQEPIVLLAADEVKHLTENQPHAAILANTQSMLFAAAENGTTFQADSFLQTADSQTALQIEQAFLGMKAFLTLSGNKPSALTSLLQNWQIQTDGNLVSIHFEVPTDTLYEALKQWHLSHEQAKSEPTENPTSEEASPSPAPAEP